MVKENAMGIQRKGIPRRDSQNAMRIPRREASWREAPLNYSLKHAMMMDSDQEDKEVRE